jgi:hypothetical protein
VNDSFVSDTTLAPNDDLQFHLKKPYWCSGQLRTTHVHFQGFSPVSECYVKAESPWTDLKQILRQNELNISHTSCRSNGVPYSCYLLWCQEEAVDWFEKDSDATQNEFKAIRVWIKNCPVLEIAFFPFDGPWEALQNILRIRGFPDSTSLGSTPKYQ